MNIRDHSSQFTVYVFTTNVDRGASAKVHLSQAGYDAYFFQDAEALELRLHENPPHLLVFSTEALGGALSDFVEHVQKINDEIFFIAITPMSHFEVLSHYNAFGIVDVISDDATALEARTVWSVDRACEKMYLTYQNEQLFEDLQNSKKKMEEVHKAAVNSMKVSLDDKGDVKVFEAKELEINDLVAKIADATTNSRIDINAEPEAPSPVTYSAKLALYRAAQSKEDLIQRFLNNISGTMCIFFKFLPSVRSFVATHGNGVDGSEIQGVGCQLESTETKDLNTLIAMGQLPERFNAMLKEAFHFSPPKALPLYGAQAVDGVFVYSGNLALGALSELNEEFALFSLCYTNFVLEKKVDSLEVQDYVTELHNRNYYLKILNDEVERSRRLKQPVSVVKISLDDFYEIESSLGEAVRDELLKSVATVVAKTSRSNDQSCRSGVNELAMVLPHCSKKGAALRAERLRRIVEATSFLDSGMKVSISLGISEYPTLCDSTKTLDETASKALVHIAERGGNKICLYKAPESHRPEFEVPPEG